jgi:hypothetical protein
MKRNTPRARLRGQNSEKFRDFTNRIIAESRANGGKVGPPFEGATLLLLTTTGTKSGQPLLAPLV